jgi:hypothetical protein
VFEGGGAAGEHGRAEDDVELVDQAGVQRGRTVAAEAQQRRASTRGQFSAPMSVSCAGRFHSTPSSAETC